MRTTKVEEAAALVPDGATLMVGGFMGVGSPEGLIDELVRQGRRDLTVIANDSAQPGVGIGKLVTAGVTTWSGEIMPTGTICSTSAITVAPAIAITGLKLRAVSA